MTLIHDVNNDLLPTDKLKMEKSADAYEQRVKTFFTVNYNKNYTAEEINKYVPCRFLSSTRRTLTNLMTEGFLEKCSDAKKMGSAGVMICTYIYRQKINEQLKLVL